MMGRRCRMERGGRRAADDDGDDDGGDGDENSESALLLQSGCFVIPAQLEMREMEQQ
jgi:hypothetical protein